MAARTNSSFDLLRTEIAEMRGEMRAGFVELREEMRTLGRRIDDTRRDMLHGVIAMFGSIMAVFAVLLGQTL